MSSRARLALALAALALLAGGAQLAAHPSSQANETARLHVHAGVHNKTLVSEEPHPADACSAPYHLAGAGWDICWQLEEARAQGVEINQAYFENRSVVWKMGVPFSLTRYDEGTAGPFKDTMGRPGDGNHPGFGRGAMQLNSTECPRFYTAGTLLRNDTLCAELRQGPEPAMAVWTKFDIFNYRFIQGYQFDSRGHVHPLILMGGELIGIGGRGAEDWNHYHHPYWRIDLDVASDGNDTIQVFADRPSRGTNGQVTASACQLEAGFSVGWCNVTREATIPYVHRQSTKWRVKDAVDENAHGNDRSFEVFQRSESPNDEYATTDVLALQFKGDSSELGYEVPTIPGLGDIYIRDYYIPSETIEDPVLWVAQHIYHDTRDEDRGSMSYHEVGPELRPHNFVDENPGESTFP